MISTLRLRLLVSLETLLAFGAAAACFRYLTGLRLFQQPGQLFAGYNVLPYLGLWLFTPIFLTLTRRNLASFGITSNSIRYHLSIAAAGFIPFFILSVLLNWIDWKHWTGAALISLVETALLVATAWFLRRHPDRGGPVLLGLGVLLIPQSVGQAYIPFLNVAYAYLLVAPAEEMFFRGYLQSRLNMAFGRPYCTFGVQWGWGLAGSALLFGIWHLAAVPQPTWPQALWTFFLGLMLGIVREKSGGVLAPSLLHGVVNYGPQAFLYNLFW